MANILLVMIGGAAGAGLRYQIGAWCAALSIAATWPVATFAVNIVGGLAMGALTGWVARTGSNAEQWQLLIGVGLLGGFTTFSAFSLDIVAMLQSGRSIAALGYALVSVVGAVLALGLGLFVVRSL